MTMTTKLAAIESGRIERYLAYQKIVEEIAAEVVAYYDHDVGAYCCSFCDVILIPDKPHEDDCIWVRSKALIKESK